MKRKTLEQALILALFVFLVFGLRSRFANATYTIHQNHTLISIQSPAANETYEKSAIPLIVNLSLIYGTTTTLDEFSFESLTCCYSLDNGELKNITSINVTSNKSQPDINYWNGLLHKLNLTCSTTLQDLPEGLHSINITLTLADSWGTYQNTSQTHFTVNLQATQTPSPCISSQEAEPFPTTLVIAVAASVVVICTGLLVYFKKRRS